MVVPGRGGWGGWQSRETNIRERLRGTAELGFHIGLSSLPKLSPKPKQGNKYTEAFERYSRIGFSFRSKRKVANIDKIVTFLYFLDTFS